MVVGYFLIPSEAITMGNVCSNVRDALDYIWRCVLPRYARFFYLGYSNTIGQNFASTQDFVDKPLACVDDLVIVPSECYDQESTGNNGIFQEIVSNFFSTYNFQIQVLNGNFTEKNVIHNHNNAFQRNKANHSWRRLNAAESKTNLGFEQMDFEKDLISGFGDIKINEINGNSKLEENIQADLGYIHNQHHESDSQRHAKSLTHENLKIESVKDNARNQRKHGILPTDDNLSFRGQYREKFSKSYSLEDGETCNNLTSDNCSSNKVYNVRKLSLSHLHSGSHFLVDEGNENIKLDDYSLESPPLEVPIETYRKMSHQNLCSGGTIAFEELSNHLASPDYYAEDLIVYNELPEGDEFPKSPPMEVPLERRTVWPESFSGGDLSPEHSRMVSLPDVYPENDPLLRSVSRESSTQSSPSFGRLVFSEEDQQMIFSDLITQSLQFDEMMDTQTAESENTN